MRWFHPSVVVWHAVFSHSGLGKHPPQKARRLCHWVHGSNVTGSMTASLPATTLLRMPGIAATTSFIGNGLEAATSVSESKTQTVKRTEIGTIRAAVTSPVACARRLKESCLCGRTRPTAARPALKRRDRCPLESRCSSICRGSLSSTRPSVTAFRYTPSTRTAR